MPLGLLLGKTYDACQFHITGAYCIYFNPEDEYDMWIGFEAPVVNSWTYYLEGSFGYIFQPTGYTGNLIELDIEDRG